MNNDNEQITKLERKELNHWVNHWRSTPHWWVVMKRRCISKMMKKRNEQWQLNHWSFEMKPSKQLTNLWNEKWGRLQWKVRQRERTGEGGDKEGEKTIGKCSLLLRLTVTLFTLLGLFCRISCWRRDFRKKFISSVLVCCKPGCFDIEGDDFNKKPLN